VNLSAVPNFALFEGEIIVVEGINSTANMTINANRIHKLKIPAPVLDLSIDQIKEVTQVLFKNKPLQLMIACGPFTLSNSLSYQGLKDFLEVVKKDEPNAMILMGPFLDQNNEEISMGELFY
jgi:DNA polymerase alpha subunit B